ncbi:uncharacterized protein LOC143545083 [Bidens hawaiensis]|uniref:uncharacterized protein LOC143545083 n=1 Tax=Bidens hawaiensis TaxID=980011 RepID=UPI00404B2279
MGTRRISITRTSRGGVRTNSRIATDRVVRTVRVTVGDITEDGYQGNSSSDESIHSKLDALLKVVTDNQKETQRQFELRDKSAEAMSKQIGQLASDMAKLQKTAGQLPSDTTVNPQHFSSSSSSKKHVNQVSILRYGKKYDNNVGDPPSRVDGVVEDINETVVSDDETEPVLIENNKSEIKINELVMKDGNNNSKDKRKAKTVPYPDALLSPSKAKMASKRGAQQEEMWETFRQVKINISLLDVIKQVPACAKYLKDLCTKKRNRKIPKQIDLTDNMSAILSGALPPKLQDLGTPLISIQVGDFKMTQALLDLGASISILPGSLYDQYDFGSLRAAATAVVLADQALKLPRGMLHDVIVKVEDFYFPVDFLVLDYVSGERTKQPTVILGRPFLATANAKIDCQADTVDLAFGNHKLRLNVFTHVNNASVDDECFMADIIDKCIPLYDSVVDTDGTTETYFMFDILQVETDKQLEEEEKTLEVAALPGNRPPWSVQVEPLPEKIDTGLQPSLQEAPKVELKELPRHLKYAFLGKNDTLPESALLKHLVANKEAIGWTIADLKGISLSIVMHKILTDPDVKPAHDAQRQLNPNIREVMKKEVLKWLDARIIFAISDSTWVSPTQDSPKEGGHPSRKDNSGNEVATQPLGRVLERCVETNLVLSWEKSRFMVQEGIVLGHVVSSRAIGVDHAKVQVIFTLPHLTNVKVGAVLGQRVEKKHVAIYYASKTLSEAQLNYTTTEKELLAVVYALDKFRYYIWGSKVIVYSDHSAVRYLMDKKDAKPRLIRWALLLQEFDLEIRDKKATENVVADYLSLIVLEDGDRDGPINESFPDEQILAVSQNPWFAHIVNFKVGGDLPEH